MIERFFYALANAVLSRILRATEPKRVSPAAPPWAVPSHGDAVIYDGLDAEVLDADADTALIRTRGAWPQMLLVEHHQYRRRPGTWYTSTEWEWN